MSKKIFAHRGIPTLAPENTMPAFNAVVANGLKWIETDLSITKDEDVFIIHDDKLDRTTDQTGSIETVDTETVGSADAGSWYDAKFKGEKIPTLSQLINFLNKNKINANIELKGVVGDDADYLADKLVLKFSKALEKLDPEIDLIISSFNPIMLAKMYKLNPELKYAVLFEHTAIQDDWNLIMQASHAKIIHPDDTDLTKEKIDMIKKYNYQINVWTVDNKERAKQLLDWGVDGIFTNKADQMKDLV
ncbi:glycerophosphodiester phosphodiesterase family protein [Companilactobacillus ginsenosidimutans]|uniref:Glycerophosphodiester phosphodiesterase n=1 Tax=Companilactobacillus ginsenosidimutans TaxID=1007676 RepID=A0A0H4QLN8_9LACO|nr:glycerophosphodiester phosphodiesterase family protein [Companilactobacillus ginsenosidimutans]AKP68016.1 glycerophosphodiester phosphodiesterase [Companilactobacillus ginsenosidimutans]